jgi:hypothetical protein
MEAFSMGLLMLAALLEATVAFAALDSCFRWMAVHPDRLDTSLRRTGRLYGLVGLVAILTGTWVSVRQVGIGAGIMLAPFGFIWWALWWFGIRKQFPYGRSTKQKGRPNLP